MIVLASIIIFVSCLIQGITSFGFSLVAVPLLSVFLSLKLIVPLLVIFSFVLNSIILIKLKDYINFKEIYLLILSAVIATPIGANILINVNERILQLMVGIVVVFSAILFKTGFKIKLKNEKLAYFPVGILSGILNGAVSLSGPPVILFLTNQDKDKQVFRATLTSFFWILNIVTIFVFFNKGLINQNVIKNVFQLMPSLLIGSILGVKIGNKVKEDNFKNLTISLMTVMGILSIVRNIK